MESNMKKNSWFLSIAAGIIFILITMAILFSEKEDYDVNEWKDLGVGC